MKAGLKIILPALIIFLISASPILARSGCCSHHGGVCGCGCCDGSPLSSTCAPYYPQCNRQVLPVYIPTLTPTPTSRPTSVPTLRPTFVPTVTPTTSLVQSSSTTNSMGWIVGGVAIFVGWIVWRHRKEIGRKSS